MVEHTGRLLATWTGDNVDVAESVLADGEMVARHSGIGWKASRTLWRLKEAGWVEKDGPPGPAAEQNWSLTETGARLAAERLANRTKNQGGTR